MAQRHRKSYVIQTFGIDAALLQQAKDTLTMRNLHTREAPMNMSEWIRRAIAREISHAKRSRRKKKLDSVQSVVYDTPTADGAAA